MDKDFWHDEERRLSWDEIEVGVERPTRPVTLRPNRHDCVKRWVTQQSGLGDEFRNLCHFSLIRGSRRPETEAIRIRNLAPEAGPAM